MPTDTAVVALINGVECHYRTAPSLRIERDLKYVDVFGLLPLIHALDVNPTTGKWDPQNILFSGPPGEGKSLLPAYYCQRNQIPYLALDCNPETRERKMLGGFGGRDGTTYWMMGTLSEAIITANDEGVAALVIEEINTLSPPLQKTLNSLLDFRKKVEVPELSTTLALRPDAALLVFATMNPSEFGGTYDMNHDLKSRFFEVDVPYPAPATTKQILREMVPVENIPDHIINSIISIAMETRQGATGYALSTRDLVSLLTILPRVGWETVLFLLSQKFTEADRKLMVRRIHDITQVVVPERLGKE